MNIRTRTMQRSPRFTNDPTTMAGTQEPITRSRHLPPGFDRLAALVTVAGCALAGCSANVTPAPTATGTSTEQAGTSREALALGGGEVGAGTDSGWYWCTGDGPGEYCECYEAWPGCYKMLIQKCGGNGANMFCSGPDGTEPPCWCVSQMGTGGSGGGGGIPPVVRTVGSAPAAALP
jgi:hypothetical protein